MEKISILIVSTLFLISLNACDKNDLDPAENKAVEQFIEALKSGGYESLDLPDFTHHDIPALLQHRNDRQFVTKFPNNPISSYAMESCALGMFVLWTIESIRAVSINSPNLVLNFPSQNPVLVLRHSTELQLVMDESSHDRAAEAYFEWWKKNKKKRFNKFNHIDPLSDTEYRWK